LVELMLLLHFSHLFFFNHSVAQLMVSVVLHAAQCAHMQLAVSPSRSVRNGLLLTNFMTLKKIKRFMPEALLEYCSNLR